MNPQSKWDDLLHDIKAKSMSLHIAVGLLRDGAPSEKREVLTLMNAAAQDILRYLSEVEKEMGSGAQAR